MAFCGDDKDVTFPEISYGFYKVFADLYGVKYNALPLGKDFSIDYKRYFNAKPILSVCKEIVEIASYRPDCSTELC